MNFDEIWVWLFFVGQVQKIKSITEDNKVNFKLVRVETEELEQYKLDMQAAFQKGFENVFGEMVGGAIVVIDERIQHNHLDLLFVKNGV